LDELPFAKAEEMADGAETLVVTENLEMLAPDAEESGYIPRPQKPDGVPILIYLIHEPRSCFISLHAEDYEPRCEGETRRAIGPNQKADYLLDWLLERVPPETTPDSSYVLASNKDLDYTIDYGTSFLFKPRGWFSSPIINAYGKVVMARNRLRGDPYRVFVFDDLFD
jgi:hypothetical protein